MRLLIVKIQFDNQLRRIIYRYGNAHQEVDRRIFIVLPVWIHKVFDLYPQAAVIRVGQLKPNHRDVVSVIA